MRKLRGIEQETFKALDAMNNREFQRLDKLLASADAQCAVLVELERRRRRMRFRVLAAVGCDLQENRGPHNKGLTLTEARAWARGLKGKIREAAVTYVSGPIHISAEVRVVGFRRAPWLPLPLSRTKKKK